MTLDYYDLELEKITEQINTNSYKSILLHLPDGLKHLANNIIQYIKQNTENTPEIYIWFGTNFGSCDIPLYIKNYGIDAIFTFGHAPFIKENGW